MRRWMKSRGLSSFFGPGSAVGEGFAGLVSLSICSRGRAANVLEPVECVDGCVDLPDRGEIAARLLLQRRRHFQEIAGLGSGLFGHERELLDESTHCILLVPSPSQSVVLNVRMRV